MGNQNKHIYTGLLILLVLSCVANTFGQGRSDNFWIFGSTGQGLQFGLSDDSLTDNTIPTETLGNAGSAVAVDPITGDIYFYTDGSVLYDGQGQTIPGLDIGNGTGNQPVVIVPMPGDDIIDGVREYYAFVNDGGTLYYYTILVDLTGGGYPSVTVDNGPTDLGISNVAPGMTVVPSADGSTYYIVTQEAGTPNFQVIDAATLTPTLVTTAPDITAPFAATNMEYSPATGQLAVAYGGGVHVLNTDGAGGLSFSETVGTGPAVNDVAWSRDGSKLYYSTGATIFQHDFTSGTFAIVPGVTGNGSFGLQQGPDGSVYHLYETAGGEYHLGRITMADSAATLVTYENELLNGANFGGSQFPQVAYAAQGDLVFNVQQIGQCTNNPVQLIPQFPEGTPQPDSIIWALPSGDFNGFSPAFTPEEAGGSVPVVAYWGDSAVFQVVPLNLQDFQLQIPIVQDTTICPGDSTILCAAPESGQGQGGQQPGGGGVSIPGVGGGDSCDPGNYTYLWSTGATTPDITVTEAGVYWVLVSDPQTGCTAYAESNVKEYQVENQTYNVWYFGNGAGIDFNNLYDNPNNPDDNGDGEDNDGQVVAVSGGQSTAPEGVEAISDANGDGLFYTDGHTLYFVNNGNHSEVPDATGVPADLTAGTTGSATMVGMVQIPGTDASYYIFTATPVEEGGYALRYATVNLNGLNPLTGQPGPVVTSSNNVLFVRSTERISIQGGRGGPATLIVHEYGNNNFRAYSITEQGIGTPVVSSVGSNHDLTVAEDAQGYIKFGGDSTGTIVGVVADNRVELFNFDQATLEMTDPTVVDFSSVGAQPYGIEFQTDSTGNTVVIVSTDNGIYVASVDRPLEEGSIINISPVSNATGVFGAIQQGPDGQVYVAQDGATSLGTVSGNPNDPTSYTYQTDQVELPNGATVTRGLPSYVNQGGNSFPEPNITVDDACVGNETMFSAQGRDDVIETYDWVIVRLNEDGTESFVGLTDSLRTEQSFSFAIDTVGDYEARVTLSNECDIDTVMVQAFTMGVAPEVTLPESVNLCNGGVDLTAVDPADDDGTLTFQWIQQGAVGGGNLPPTNTITATEPGFYNVTVMNADSCISEGEVFVVDNRPQIALPEDFTLCQNEERELDVEVPSAGDPGYEWIILDENDQVVTSINEPVIEVSEITPDAGIYQYTVTVTDDIGCFVQDTVVVTILESPAIESSVIESSCGTDDGEITVNVTSDPNETYTYTLTDRSGTMVDSGTGLTFTTSSLGAGVYTATVSNSLGCTTNQNISISDANADFNVADPLAQSGCDDTGTFAIEINPNDPPNFNGVNWTIYDENGFAVYNGTNTSSLSFSIPETNPSPNNGLAPGFYSLEFESIPGGCIRALDNLEIPEPDSVDFDLPRFINACDIPTPVAALDPATGEPLNPGNNTYSFVWTNITGGVAGNAGLSSRTRNPVQISQSGIYEVEVTDLIGAVCPATRQVEVTFETPPTIQTIVELEDNSCEAGEKVIGVEFVDPNVASGNNLIYEWSVQLADGTVLTNIGASQNITVDRTGEYSVVVRRRGGNSACTIASRPQPVVVNQPLSVTILYGSACADGTDIPLVARVRTDGTDSLRYEWYNAEGTRLPASSDTLLLRPNMPDGEYSVIVTQLTANGCSADAAASVTRNPVPETNLGEGPFIICTDTSADPDEQYVVLEVSPASAINWITPTGSDSNTTTLPASVPGMYIVEITNEFGCTIIDSVEVIEDCTPSIVAPNAFRPGGVNSEFFVYPRYVADEDFEIRIYNRWGELVFQSNSKDFRWDGTYNGRPAPLGSYPYIITYKSDTDTSGDLLEERGGVTIIR
uniref:Gliding motility-associated C-terminal domain-containing protein n=1 Tax=Roseihalotalea indica TaxID=2867963 RepID=A0AA49JJ51_9BACT|nr:gliding motility-associated C-terminal domain-containing protein [Tunicatimonas sp. TK19036]